MILAHGPAVKLATGGLDPQDAVGAYFFSFFLIFLKCELGLVVLTREQDAVAAYFGT